MRESEVYTKIGVYPHPCLTELMALHRLRRTQTRHGPMDGMCFVIELCTKGDLSQAMQRGVQTDELGLETGYTPPSMCRQWVGQIFLGLEHLHLKAHALMRDMKPPNVLLDDNYCCKISDYGMSKIGLSFRGWATFCVPVGTPGYASPEVMCDEEGCGSPCDIYSLGVMTWVMFSGGDTRRSRFLNPPGAEGGGVVEHQSDWERFEEVVRQHPRLQYVPLEQDVLHFVRETTHRSPDKRLKHVGIRQSDFMSSLQLPPRGDSEQCRAWLASLAVQPEAGQAA